MRSSMVGIPPSCDCVWSIAELPDGSRAGSIHIASERCQRLLMHPRTFIEPASASGAREADCD